MFLSRVGALKPRSAVKRAQGHSRASSLPSSSAAIQSAAILESLDSAIIGRGLDGAICTWNVGAERLYGYAADEIIGRPFDSIVPDGDRSSVGRIADAAVLMGLTDRHEVGRLCKDGTEIQVDMQISPVRDPAGWIVGTSVIDRTGATLGGDERSIESPAYLSRAFEDAPIATALVGVEPNHAGRIIRVNSALCELTGYSSEQLETGHVDILLHPEDAESDLANMEQLRAGEIDSFHVEERLLHSERHAVWVTMSVAITRDATGRPLFCIRQFQDIGERKRYESELGYLVEHDPLTGLFNRTGFIRELTHEIAYARRYGGGSAVLSLDLDDLKFVNDTLGHDAGDDVLSEVARIVNQRLRETDSFGRLGGDEFAVLLPHTTLDQAQTLSRSLLGAVREGCKVSMSEGRPVSLSIGIVAFREPSESLTAEDLLLDADDAMYTAKEAGKDRIAVAGAETRERTKSRVTWAERVREAVDGGLFELFCQPIVDFSIDRVSQWELLLRLPSDSGELILPAQFLYTAERSGLILEIDRWVLSEAIKLIADCRDAGREVRLEVNISGRSVGNDELLGLIEQGVKETGIDPRILVLDVTETAAIANMDRARGFATALQSLGCGFALDDFGAGFGSFYYLKHIPFDYVKIDGEFIRNLPTSDIDQLILAAIVQMAKGLGKATIAEFVGDQATVDVLKEHGVDYGQGFHLGRPRPVMAALIA
jgi:diguanylate cyclase (GGDEF)-like protein/PAS domain S-box-containing protein